MQRSNNLKVEESECAASLAMSSSSSDGGGPGPGSGCASDGSDTEGAAPVPEADHASASAGGLASLSKQGRSCAVGDEDKHSDSADDSKAGDALSGEGEEAVRRDRRVPPRDMKRLRKAVRYKVVEVDAWGGSPVLALEDDKHPGERGRYKLPWKHAGTAIAVGDTVELLGTAFSESRNLIATEVVVRDAEGEVRKSQTGASGAGSGKGVRRRSSSVDCALMAHKRMCATPQLAAQLTAATAAGAQMRASGGFTYGNYLVALMDAQRAASAGLQSGMAALNPEQLVAMGGAFHPQCGLLPPGAPLLLGMPFQQLAGGAGVGAGVGVGIGGAAAAATTAATAATAADATDADADAAAPDALGPRAAACAAAPLAAGEAGTPSAALSSLAHINAAAAAVQHQQMLFSLRMQQEHELDTIKRQQLLQAHPKQEYNGGGYDWAIGATGLYARSPLHQQHQPPGTGTGAHLAELPAASNLPLLLSPELQLQQLLYRQQLLLMEPSLMYGAAAMQHHAAQQSKKSQHDAAGAHDDE